MPMTPDHLSGRVGYFRNRRDKSLFDRLRSTLLEALLHSSSYKPDPKGYNPH